MGQLGHLDAVRTTVVFDAADPPANRPVQSSHKGMTLLFAVNEENADAAIERLIAQDSAPRQLAVVSSDRRVREAARRRGATMIEADTFWSGSLKHAEPKALKTPARQALERQTQRAPAMDPEEARQFELQFAEADRQLADPHRPGNQTPLFLSDEEIRQLERDIKNETWEP